MNKWLQKIMSPAPAIRRNLPAKLQQAQVPILKTLNNLELTKGLPNAAIIYGVAAGAFFTFALVLMVRGHWIDGFLTLMPAACFVGFAMHFIKHDQASRKR